MLANGNRILMQKLFHHIFHPTFEQPNICHTESGRNYNPPTCFQIASCPFSVYIYTSLSTFCSHQSHLIITSYSLNKKVFIWHHLVKLIMGCKIHFLLCFFFVLYGADAFNITKILNDYPDFSMFNNLLSQTQLASAINSRMTITVLVVDNGNIGSLAGKPAQVMKNILSVHVLLDYYDTLGVKDLQNKSVTATTLFQTSGRAIGQQGFLHITDVSGTISIGSAVRGAKLDSNVVKQVLTQPFNISIMQVSTPILPPGIESAPPTTSPPAPAPRSRPPRSSPVPSPSNAPSPTLKRSPPPKPSRSPASSPPQPDAPTADTPAADAPAADSDKPKANAGAALRLSLETFIFMVVSAATSLVAMMR